MAAFCASGLAAGEKVMHVAPERLQDPVLSSLAETGHDVERLIELGRLEARPIDQIYRTEEDFDPPRQVETYREAIDAACSQGYSGLRVGADGTPLLGRADLTAYELRADLLASRSPYVALCAYDRRVCDQGTLTELESVHALRAHRAGPSYGPTFSIHGTDDGGIALGGEFDLVVRDQLRELLLVANEAVTSPTIDLSRLAFADLSSVRSIAEAAQGLSATTGEDVVLRDAPSVFRKIWQLAGFDAFAPSVVFRSGEAT